MPKAIGAKEQGLAGATPKIPVGLVADHGDFALWAAAGGKGGATLRPGPDGHAPLGRLLFGFPEASLTVSPGNSHHLTQRRNPSRSPSESLSARGTIARGSAPAAKGGGGAGEKRYLEGAEREGVRVLLTQHLTHIISRAVFEKDGSLTKKVCRERLGEVFGELVADNKPFVNDEVCATTMLQPLNISTYFPTHILTNPKPQTRWYESWPRRRAWMSRIR